MGNIMRAHKAASQTLFWAFLVIVFSIGGCTSDEDKKSAHWVKAREYIELGELDNAVIELKNIVKIDARDDEASYELGEIYMAKHDLIEAYRSFGTAVAINPENLDARLRMGQILLLVHKTRDARDMAQEILKRSPFHMGASILLARIQLQEEDPESAKNYLDSALTRDPNHLSAWLTLGEVHLRMGNLEEADRAFMQAVELDESLGPLQVEEGPHSTAPVLAKHYERTGEWERADAMYQKVIEVHPKGRIPAMMELAAFYSRAGMYEKALDTMQAAAEERQGDLDIMVQIAKLHLDFAQFDEAEDYADKVLAVFPTHLGARLIKGRILLGKGNYDGALGHLEAVIHETPGRGAAHYFRGMALMGKGEVRGAQESLIRSLEIDPGLIGARFLLAKIYLGRFESGNLSLARRELVKVLEAVPNDVEALILYGNLNIRENDLAGAEAAFNKVITRKPDDPLSHFRLGTVYHLMGKNQDAINALERSLELDPEDINTVGFLVDIYIKVGSLDKAVNLCLDKRPAQASDKDNAVFEQLLGKIYIAKADMVQAEDHFKRALDYAPGLLPAHRALTELYLRSGRTEEIINHYEKAVEVDPGFLPGYVILGLIRQESGEREKAAQYYRGALEIKKDFGPAASNLALILAESGEDLDEALRLAQVARERMPNDPNAMDTLGWIYHLLGHSWKAIPELERAVELAPGNPLFQYHLGKAYYSNRDIEKAETHLAKALDIDQDFRHSEDARLTIEMIREAE